MARKWTFGTSSFGSLVTARAQHLLDGGQLQQAQNVSRDVAGALGPSASNTVVYSSAVDILGMAALRYGGATHVFHAGQFDVYEDNVAIGTSGGPQTHRFVCDSDRVYVFSGVNNSVWDGATYRAHGPFGSSWANVDSTAETMMVKEEGSSGTPAGLTGSYRWAASYRATLESGQVIESKLYPLWVYGGAAPEDHFSGAVDMISTDGAIIYIRQVTQAEVDAWCPDLGTGKVEGVVWRTKAGGVDYWEQSVVAESDIVGMAGRHSFYDEVSDAALGAEYLYADDSASAPPSGANLAVFCQRRLFLAVKGSRTLYFSGIDRYDAFSPTDTVDCEESIEGLSTFGESVAVATPTSIRLWSPVDETGQWSNSSSSVGTTHSRGLAPTDMGLLFARNDGLYLFDGVGSRRVSEEINPTWQQVSTDEDAWRGAYSNGFGFWSNGLAAVEFKLTNGAFEWSTSDLIQSSLEIGHICADPSDDGLWYSDLEGHIGRLHLGTGVNTATIKTKDYGDGNVRHWDRIVLDFSGSFAVTVTTNRGNTQAFVASLTPRQQLRTMLPATMIGELCNVTLVGTGTLYRIELETT